MVQMNVPKTEYYQGEPILLDFMVYWSPRLEIGLDGVTLPDFTDFWVEEVELPQQRASMVLVEGERYNVQTVIRRRLFANRPGDLVIADGTFTFSTRFGFGRKAERSTGELPLKIKPLPETGRPDGFKGLVGNFDLTASLSEAEVKVGDSVSLNLELKGRGNFAAVSQQTMELDPNLFEVFNGGVEEQKTALGEVSGKVWSFALVPKEEGTYDIPIPELAYFDPDSGSYKLTGNTVLPLKVLPGKGVEGGMVGSLADNRDFSAEQNLSFIKLGELGTTRVNEKRTPPGGFIENGGSLCSCRSPALFPFVRLRTGHQPARQYAAQICPEKF